jgi:hypothetical protein
MSDDMVGVNVEVRAALCFRSAGKYDPWVAARVIAADDERVRVQYRGFLSRWLLRKTEGRAWRRV